MQKTEKPQTKANYAYVCATHYEGLGQDELGVWHAPGGAKVAWFKDPDGNTLSMTQF